MKKIDLSILNNADDEIIETLLPFSSDEETRKRVLSMSEKKFDEMMNEKEHKNDDKYSVTVSGVERYHRPVWHKALGAAAALVVIAGGVGTGAFLMHRSPADPLTSSQTSEDINSAATTEPGTELVTEAPVINIANDTIRFMSAAYAPYILDISEQQQKELADALVSAKWTPYESDGHTPDGESYVMYVYNNGAPYRLTLYADKTAELEKDGKITRWQISDETAALIASAANPSDESALTNHLTWCAEDSINATDIWKNTRVGARECDMSDKKDIFFKMNNTADYFDRASGTVKTGVLGYDTVPFGDMKVYDFQVDLNNATAYQHEENYYGTSYEALIACSDEVTSQNASYIYAQDGEYSYSIRPSEGTYDKYKDVVHRIDSPTVPFEELRCLDNNCTEYDMWNSRRQILGGISTDCIENYRMAVDLLQDFDSWDIVGTEEVEGRKCVHIKGVYNVEYDSVKKFDLYVDEETGTTVKMLGYDYDGNIIRFIVTENLAFDDDAEPVQTPVLSRMKENDYSVRYADGPAYIAGSPEENGPVTEVPVTDVTEKNGISEPVVDTAE